MEIRQLKTMLEDQLSLERDLYDFCIECLKKIYGKDSSMAVHAFESNYNYREDYGCIKSLEQIDQHVKNRIKELEDLREKRLKEEK